MEKLQSKSVRIVREITVQKSAEFGSLYVKNGMELFKIAKDTYAEGAKLIGDYTVSKYAWSEFTAADGSVVAPGTAWYLEPKVTARDLATYATAVKAEQKAVTEALAAIGMTAEEYASLAV